MDYWNRFIYARIDFVRNKKIYKLYDAPLYDYIVDSFWMSGCAALIAWLVSKIFNIKNTKEFGLLVLAILVLTIELIKYVRNRLKK